MKITHHDDYAHNSQACDCFSCSRMHEKSNRSCEDDPQRPNLVLERCFQGFQPRCRRIVRVVQSKLVVNIERSNGQRRKIRRERSTWIERAAYFQVTYNLLMMLAFSCKYRWHSRLVVTTDNPPAERRYTAYAMLPMVVDSVQLFPNDDAVMRRFPSCCTA